MNTLTVLNFIDLYIRGGFVAFQAAINMAYIHLVSKKSVKELHPRVSNNLHFSLQNYPYYSLKDSDGTFPIPKKGFKS